VSEFLLFQF